MKPVSYTHLDVYKRQVDYLVDRAQLQARQRVQASATNSPSSSSQQAGTSTFRDRFDAALCDRQGGAEPSGGAIMPAGASPASATMEAGITRSHSELGS